MTKKRATRKRVKSDEIQKDFVESYEKNFNLTSFKLKKQLNSTENQTNFYHLLLDDKTNMVFVDGPAGSSKTYIGVYGAMELLKEGKADQVIYIRSVVESSSRSIGALPGELDDKFSPYTLPLMDKLYEITDKSSADSLLKNQYVKAIPVNFVRGLTFHNSVVIIDEAQNLTRGELTTLLTRFGRHTKYIICGDGKQADIRDSGFKTVFDLFDTDFSLKNDIHCLKFDNFDIVRSPILRHIAQVLSV